jgi:hypothetical protein
VLADVMAIATTEFKLVSYGEMEMGDDDLTTPYLQPPSNLQRDFHLQGSSPHPRSSSLSGDLPSMSTLRLMFTLVLSLSAPPTAKDYLLESVTPQNSRGRHSIAIVHINPMLAPKAILASASAATSTFSWAQWLALWRVESRASWEMYVGGGRD